MNQQTQERYFTRAEERALFRTLRRFKGDILARRDLAMMLIMRYTGARVGSLVGLNVRDADHALTHHELYFRKAKGGRDYSVPANRVCRRALRELLSIRRLQGQNNHHAEEPLIVSRQGNRLCVRQVENRVRQWCTAAGILYGTPHYFRHTLGRRLVEESTSNAPLLIVQKVLNHKSVASTGIYTSPGKEAIQDALEAQCG